MSDRENIIALVALVNGTGVLYGVDDGLEAMLEYLGPTAPAASVQHLPGARWAERYVDGSGTREQPFAVLVRTAGNDTSGRADVAAALLALADALEAAELVAPWVSITGEDTPALVERDTNGSEVWRATFVLQSTRA